MELFSPEVIRAQERSLAIGQIVASMVSGLGLALSAAGSAYFFAGTLITNFDFGSIATIVAMGLVIMVGFSLLLHQFRGAIMVLFEHVAIPELVDMALLAIWLICLWLIDKFGGILALMGDVDEYSRFVFQLLFIMSTVVPVIALMVWDMICILSRAWHRIRHEQNEG